MLVLSGGDAKACPGLNSCSIKNKVKNSCIQACCVVNCSMELQMVAWWGSPIYLDLEILLAVSILAIAYFTTIQSTMDLDNPPDYNQTILQVHLSTLES